MSYYSKPVFFYGFNSTAQTVSKGSSFALDTYKHCSAGPSTGEINVQHKAYLYGEIQTDVSVNNNNYDIVITNNNLLLHEGYQTRNNSTIGAMDDGVYAQVSTAASMQIANYYAYSSDKSDAYQARLYGVNLS